MIDLKEQIIDNEVYILSKFPAVAGREIIANYPLSGMPKVGDYKVNEETMLKLMCFVFVPNGSGRIALTNKALVNNHVKSWETLAKIEIAMMEYNCSFFQNGRVSNFLNDIKEKLPALISKMWTDLSAQLLQTEKRRSKS